MPTIYIVPTEEEKKEEDEEAMWTVQTVQMCYSGLFRTCSEPHQALELLSWCLRWRWRVALGVWWRVSSLWTVVGWRR